MGFNDLLSDPIRHNSWATASLIQFCRDQNLTAEQLEITGVGTYGGILATLDHIVQCDGSYLRRIVDRPIAWVEGEPAADLETLDRWNTELSALWEVFLAEPIDVERVLVIDDNTRGTRLGIFVAQAINHANHHREQVCAILTGLGIEPPDIQAWEYAWKTNRIWDLDEAQAQ
ncbi:DinB family protein [Kribbella shirazensis]|uniref:Putative damage-inducible protein DinB n=1 Tax=Kribbella shirazensis TaxID=1105143 RepID=A0A7X6A0B9_9ACTN|nr:DinB family protein [Kribbella shirazensis]NIK56014.1 putative damage-inducible protein DinB [Kribbella shirazensis]